MNETSKLGFSRLGWEWRDEITRHGEAPNLVKQLTPEIWKMLWDRNALGIELFEYMKQLSFDMLKKDGLPVPSLKDELAAVPSLAETPHRASDAQGLEIEQAL